MVAINHFQIIRKQRDKATHLLENFRHMIVSSGSDASSDGGCPTHADLDRTLTAIQAERRAHDELIEREAADRKAKSRDDTLPADATAHLVALGRYWLMDHDRQSTGFDEDFYLDTNPDIREAVSHRRFRSGFHHWLTYGAAENRAYRFKDTLPLAELCAENNRVKMRSTVSSKIKTLFGAGR